jgi:hypothetical protein
MTVQAPLGRANIINFIRFDHGMTTVAGEMGEILKRNLPATWLLQYDALAAGPYVEYLKSTMAKNHEVGLWFEVNRRHCDDAGVRFRGELPEPENTQDTENWDHHSQAMMSCGYSQKDRIKLIDTMMEKFKQIWGKYPASVAAWYIDSYSLKYLWEKYNIAASANCKDQWGTDGYSLWGAPYHCFYYPSTTNAMSAACSVEHQVHVPIFRMLGNDPINARNAALEGNGQPVYTLEPAYKEGGGNPEWVKKYFDIMLNESTQPFGYLQIGQENSFPWDLMKEGFCFQLDEVMRRRDQGRVVIETLEQSGRYVQEKYKMTPAGFLDANINLNGGKTQAVWYHSANYRTQVLYSDTSMEIVDLYRYLPIDIESHHQSPANLWNEVFMPLPMVDSFLFGSRWYLEGTLSDGRKFDERQIPISDVKVEFHDDLMTIRYKNGVGVQSEIKFMTDCIEFNRQCNKQGSLREIISLDPQSRWTPLQGAYRYHIVFGWNNRDYRLTIKESHPWVDRGQAKVVAGNFENCTESTCTVFLNPCTVEASI